jgi:peptide/nickel transport system substrate-binding protein/oligopeptide transport system substrate-binding protein
MSIDERRLRAAARVASWRRAQPSAAAPRLRIALPRETGGYLLFERLQADLRAIGIEALRVGPDDDADLRLFDAVARYPRVGWYLNQLSCVARRGLCSEDADRTAAQALRATDPGVRGQLLAEAEAVLTRANVFIPFGPPVRWSLVRGTVAGFAANRANVHPLMPMALRPK